MSGPILICAGGSGGHVLPAAALADELKRRKINNTLVVDRRGSRFLPRKRRRSTQVIATKLDHKIIGFKAHCRKIREWLGLVFTIFGQLKRVRAVGVVCFGGHFVVPFAVAAKLLGIPLILHEQNVIVGIANRLLSLLACAKAATSPCRGWFGDVIVVGLPSATAKTAKAVRPLTPPFRLTVLGGSQNSVALTETVLDALALLPLAKRRTLSLNLQCREDGIKAAEARCRELGIASTVKRFFDKPFRLLLQSHLLVSRAGAGSLNEAALAACPVIALPYPYATQRHQHANAARLNEIGGGWVIEDGEDKKLADLIRQMLKEPKRAANKGEKIKRLALPSAAERLADLTTAIARPRQVHVGNMG